MAFCSVVMSLTGSHELWGYGRRSGAWLFRGGFFWKGLSTTLSLFIPLFYFGPHVCLVVGLTTIIFLNLFFSLVWVFWGSKNESFWYRDDTGYIHVKHIFCRDCRQQLSFFGDEYALLENNLYQYLDSVDAVWKFYTNLWYLLTTFKAQRKKNLSRTENVRERTLVKTRKWARVVLFSFRLDGARRPPPALWRADGMCWHRCSAGDALPERQVWSLALRPVMPATISAQCALCLADQRQCPRVQAPSSGKNGKSIFFRR